MATITISGLSNNTAANLSSLLPVGAVITQYDITFSGTIICLAGRLETVIYNGQDSVATRTRYFANSQVEVNSIYIKENQDTISNASAFQSDRSIKVYVAYVKQQSKLDSFTYSVTITYTAPTLTWSNASLSLSQSASGLQVTATMGGTATHSAGVSVTYYLYEGSTQIGTFSNGSLTFTSTAGSHTYKTVAKAGGLTADGKSTSITVVHRLVWSNAALSLSQSASSLQVTATMGGSATHTGGSSVTYYLYEGSTQIGVFSGTTLTFTSTAGSHTYKTVASAGGLTADGKSTSLTVVQPTQNGDIGYYTNSQFVGCEIYTYDGENFIQVVPYYYDGTNWIECTI